MEKEPVTKFDLEAAFKALDELDIPVAEKGIAANRVNLTETFANAKNNKLKTELLIEDYYDLNSTEDLEQAKEDREDDIAKAKLARIEKIVDLDAESPEDLLPSYVGKVIIQCPQCMTLFYKDPADLEPSEDDDSIVNVNEVCQHCGNASGYNVIGKVDAVSEEESSEYDATEAETTEEPAEDELNLDFEEPTEEVDAEGTGEAEVSEEETTEETSGEEETEDELNLDFTDTEEEEEEEEKKEESLNHSKVEREAEEGSDLFTEHKTENVSLNEEAKTVSYFLDCSGSWSEDNWAKELEEIEKSEIPAKVFYFSDHIYSNKEDAFKGGSSFGCAEIVAYAKSHPEEKCIVKTDDDYKGQGGKELETLPNVELRLRGVDESLNNSEAQKDAEKHSELKTENASENTSLNENAKQAFSVVYKDNSGHQLFTGTKEECDMYINDHKDDNMVITHGGLELLDLTVESVNNSEAQKDASKNTELDTDNHSDNLTLNEEGNAKWKALSTKPRDLLSKVKADPNYKATNKYVFYGTDADGKVLATVEYEHTSDKISDLKAERNKVFDKDENIETVYVSRFFHNTKEDKDEEVEVDSYMISRNKVDESLELTEASVKDLDAKLKAHNEYIDYLKKMISQEEAALKSATNEEVKAAIQRRLDAFNDDLNKALPEAVKDDLAAEELPTPEETETNAEGEETTESLKEELVTVTVDTEPGREPIVTVTTADENEVTSETPVEEPVCVGPECEPCVGPECTTVPPVVTDIPAVVEPTAIADDIANEFGIDDATIVEPGEAVEDSDEEETEESDDDDDDNGSNGSMEECKESAEALTEETLDDEIFDDLKDPISEDEVRNMMNDLRTEDINITNNDSPSRVDNRDQSGKPAEGEKTDEGILGAVGDVVGGVVNGVKNLLASDEAEKKDQANEGILGGVKDAVNGVVDGVENILGEEKQEEGLGLFGIGDVNVNLDASGQNNAVGVGGGEGKTEELEKEGLLPDGLPTPPIKVPGLTEEEIKEDLNEGALEEGPFSWIKGKIDDASFDKAAAKAYDEFAVLVWKPNKNGYRLKDTSDKYLTLESKIYGTYKEAKDAAKTKSLANKTCADVFGIPVKGSKKLDKEFLWAFNNGETETDQKRYNEISIYTVKPDDPEAVDNSVPVVKIKRKDVAAEAKVQAAKSKLNKSTDKGSDADVEHEPHEVAEGAMPSAADIDGASKAIDGDGNKYIVQTGPDAAHDTNIFKTFTEAEKRAKEYSNWAKGATVQLAMKRDSDGADLKITYKNNALEKGNIARLTKYVNGEALSEGYNYSMVEDFDEASFNKHILAFLTETYSNVKNFEATACNFENNSLIVEGLISFESGKTKATKFEFNPVAAGDAVFFEGLNNDIYANGKAFILNCSTLDEGKTLITESLQYSYSVNGTAINGIK